MIAWPLDNTEYTAEAIGAWSGTRTRGVFSADDCFSVTAAGGFSIDISPGLAWLKAAKYWGIAVVEHSTTAQTVETGSGMLSRYVAVVIQYDKTANSVQCVLRYGEYSNDPVKPVPVRDDYYDELIVASILQRAAAVELTQADITDERLNEDMCGLMRDGVTGLPTADLYARWSDFFAGVEAETKKMYGRWETFFAGVQAETAEEMRKNEEAFDAWFDTIKGQLSEDAAGKLQLAIDEHIADTVSGEAGVHGLRCKGGVIEAKDDASGEWTPVSGGSVLDITFHPDFLGAEYTVTDESGAGVLKTGVVTESLQAAVSVEGTNTVYTVTAAARSGASAGTRYSVGVAVGAYFGRYYASLNPFDATVRVEAAAGSMARAAMGSMQCSARVGEDGVGVIHVSSPGVYRVVCEMEGAYSDSVNVDITSESEYTAAPRFATLDVTAVAGLEVTMTCEANETIYKLNKTSTGTDRFYLPALGVWTGTITKAGETATATAECPDYRSYTMVLDFVHIYGVSWDGSPTTKWTRTDDAAGFTDPVPYVAGATKYGSPFDNLQPWAGMTLVTDAAAGELVKIPKFWYKLEQTDGNGLKIQIADYAADGFVPSPAHMDKGDGNGERDVVYIGRYHCAASNYKSKNREKPKDNITRATARTEIHKLGSNIWQMDFAMRFTLWLLYLVEFADWNSQMTIGYGCGNNSSTGNMGYTDSMPYHTGTTKSNRDTYGLGTQYRNIEGLWDNVCDWMDGCYWNGSLFTVILNPVNFVNGDSKSGGIYVAQIGHGYPTQIYVRGGQANTFKCFMPGLDAPKGSETTYMCDCFYPGGTTSPLVYVGGCYQQDGECGLFFTGYGKDSLADNYHPTGCRLQKLP